MRYACVTAAGNASKRTVGVEEMMKWLSKLFGRGGEPRWEPTEEAGVEQPPGTVPRQGLANGEPAPDPSLQRTVADTRERIPK
jgi:hypothetical protein